MNIQDMIARAEKMLDQAEKLKSRAFVTARDVVKGQERLNLAFVANLFNNNPALDPPKEEIVEEFTAIEETREEKVVVTPAVSYRVTRICVSDVPQLDEFPRCQSSGQLSVLRPL